MKRILICDDATFMRAILKGIVEPLGYIVVGEAVDGRDAVEKYKSLHPDIVTLDITMPNMNGIEALKEIKILDADAKVIMCSAMGQQTFVMEAIREGARDFIVKPFDKDRIREALNKL